MGKTSLAPSSKVVVVGGGIIGLSVACSLAKRGCEVTILEKNKLGSGCSFGNAGWLTPCFSMPLPQPGLLLKSIKWLLNPESPLYIHPELSLDLLRWLKHFLLSMNQKHLELSVQILTELSLETLQAFSSLHQTNLVADSNSNSGVEAGSGSGAGGFGFSQRGLLMLASSSEGMRSALREQELVAHFNISGRQMSREEVMAFEPGLRADAADRIKGAVHFQKEAHVEPMLAVHRLHNEALKLNVKIEEDTDVLQWNEQSTSFDEGLGGKIESVLTSRGLRHADAFVLATGNWSRQFAKALRLNVPVRGGKGYSVLVDRIQPMPETPIMILERKIAITPHVQSLRIAGTLELVQDDMSINWRRLHAVMRGAAEFLHVNAELGANVQSIWRGLRPCTPDGLPMIGFSPRQRNLLFCTGHQMLGLQSSLGSGELAAKMLAGEALPAWSNSLRVDRF